LDLPLPTLHQQLVQVQVLLVMLLKMEISYKQTQYSLIVDHSNNTLKESLQTLGRGYQTPTPANFRQNARKSINKNVSSSGKRLRKETRAINSCLVLTNIISTSRSVETVTDYLKAAKTQENFPLHF
jgi:hypothetical protein